MAFGSAPLVLALLSLLAFVRHLSKKRPLNGAILLSPGEDHAHIRRIINPGFSPAQLAAISHPSEEARGSQCTFDAISENCSVVFDLDCNTLGDPRHPVMDACRNVLNVKPLATCAWFTKRRIGNLVSTLLLRSFWHYIPLSLLGFARYLPTKDHAIYKRSSSRINGGIKELIREKTQAILADMADNKRDIVSILVNATENHSVRLTDAKMISQMATFPLIGYQKPSIALAWLLYELAKGPDYHHKIREEVRDVRRPVKGRGEEGFSIADLDSMAYATAAVKEVMRLHTVITISSACSPKARLPQVWGPEAHLFNPERFVEHDKMGDAYVGMTSCLMSLGAAGNLLIEMQAILIELSERFDFAPPDDKPIIVRFPAGMMLLHQEKMGYLSRPTLTT
ncbi:cytochrome P450 [Trametes punicea]|nr:cytochrome P450 [Trametes punicea]